MSASNRTADILARIDRYGEVHDGHHDEMAVVHWQDDVTHLLGEARALTLQRDYWRAKDKLRAAGDAYVRTSKASREAKLTRWTRAKKRVRALRAELRKAGLKP